MAQPLDDWVGNARAEVPAAGVPPRTWVYRVLLRAVREGALRPGSRLPAARRLAQVWQMPRGAIDQACDRLRAEGVLARRVGDGTYVADALPAGVLPQVAAAPPVPNRAARQVLSRMAEKLRTDRPVNRPLEGVAPRALRVGVPDVEAFPLAAWRRCIARAFADEQRASLSYGAPAGVMALREATAHFLALTRGMNIRAEQVVIVNSTLQAAELIAQVMLSPGDKVCIEDPSHPSTARLLSLAHLDVRGVPFDEQGLDVAAGRTRTPNPAAIYLQPLHQYPTGIVTSAARRAALLDWAQAASAWIIEVDYLNEIAHGGPVPAPLQSGPASERVLFVGTYTGVTFPAIRLAYLVVPEPLVEPFAAVRGMLGDHSPVAPQVALADFIDAGHLSDHLRAVRATYRARRDVLVRALRERLPDEFTIGPTSGGMHACLRLPARYTDQAVVQQLARRGVDLGALSLHGWSVAGLNGLVMGYGAYDPRDIEAACDLLAEVLAQARIGEAVPA